MGIAALPSSLSFLLPSAVSLLIYFIREGAVAVCNSGSQELGASYPVCLLSTVPPRADSAVCSIGACPALRELFRKSLG